MTEEQEKLALDFINNPPPGSEIAKAKEFGVDLTLFISTLRRTPTESARALSQAAGLINSKPAAGRPRDLYVLPELKALEEVKKPRVPLLEDPFRMKLTQQENRRRHASAGSLPAAHAHLS